MSSIAMIASGKDMCAAWETEGKIYSSLLGAQFAPQAVSLDKARHPSLAANAYGETLIAWSVGTGWQRGGDLAWVVLNAAGKPAAERGTAPGVAVWSHTSAYPERDHDFVILH